MEIITQKIKAHENIYVSHKEPREMEINISVPAQINEDTMVLVLIPAFGGNYKSNIYQKMLHEFPEKYNCIVVSGDYFGSKHMLNPNKVELDLDKLSTCGGYYPVETKETENEFCDMGLMQGMDVVYMTKAALEYVGKEPEQLGHIIAFGSSHGGYLAHLANILYDGLFSCVIDISGYITPYYLNTVRRINNKSTCCRLMLGMEYYVQKHSTYHPKLYDLSYLYEYNSKTCKIIAFQGNTDWMVDVNEKMEFIKNCGDNAEIMVFTAEDVDGVFIKNTSHGLGMDFLILFEMLFPMIRENKKAVSKLPEGIVEIGTKEAKVVIDYEPEYPKIVHISRETIE